MDELHRLITRIGAPNVRLALALSRRVTVPARVAENRVSVRLSIRTSCVRPRPRLLITVPR